MKAGSGIPLWVVALLAALCLAVLAWTTFGFVVPFKHETGQAVLDTYFAGYDESAVFHMQKLLDENETATRLLRAMYFGPELIFPALLTALLFLAFLKLGPGGAWFGQSVHPLVGKAVYLLPFIYGIADYGENISSLIAFGNGASSTVATQLLPWMTRLKFASLAICFILIARLAVMRWLSSRDP
ncbi:hypothetical protein [Rhizobium ruizarguesonis]|uniref:Transmembrane protein n=1 Tax=Rhizobium ruizarguesonis TaxID=2081791 RepID=A0AAE8QB99_9HYPH|nr:hypothetical protein [Rhizobium ruizarguesonis]TAV04266.1 hypothetical protein ELI39_02665 [Rhizobium ruizarguesonis]TBA79207.1 hypothetical protein ELH56_02575 [Rhizobium ruizarguesonis]TBA83986.1 hypothetical protein ELH53_02580 [Rhizobium ruizarguesonis]TBB10111.1 hypothetical protein ELH50_02825 [Rhizobium ruizarguesonis]TBB20791.1 hypothetical protein ELH51_02575 [Rhizobium ruizarguesonis]